MSIIDFLSYLCKHYDAYLRPIMKSGILKITTMNSIKWSNNFFLLPGSQQNQSNNKKYKTFTNPSFFLDALYVRPWPIDRQTNRLMDGKNCLIDRKTEGLTYGQMCRIFRNQTFLTSTFPLVVISLFTLFCMFPCYINESFCCKLRLS